MSEKKTWNEMAQLTSSANNLQHRILVVWYQYLNLCFCWIKVHMQ